MQQRVAAAAAGARRLCCLSRRRDPQLGRQPTFHLMAQAWPVITGQVDRRALLEVDQVQQEADAIIPMNTVAVIDIGSNSVRLVVVWDVRPF